MMPHLPYPRRPYRPSAQAAESAALDLQTQLEGILDTVWKAEADWRFMDRIDMSVQSRRDPTLKGSR